MAIRKYGTEPAKVETRVEDNDPETLSVIQKRAQEGASGRREPERNSSEDQSKAE